VDVDVGTVERWVNSGVSLKRLRTMRAAWAGYGQFWDGWLGDGRLGDGCWFG
jgi:hypothetical protein